MKKTLFQIDIEKMLKNEKAFNTNARIIIVLEHSPKWLCELGFENLPIFIGPGHIKSALGLDNNRNKHNISKEILFMLPKLLNRPLAVCIGKMNRLEIFINATDKNGRIIVAILETNIRNRKYYNLRIKNSHNINSVYGLDNAINSVNKSIKGKGLLYPFNVSKNDIIKKIVKIQKNSDYIENKKTS